MAFPYGVSLATATTTAAPATIPQQNKTQEPLWDPMSWITKCLLHQKTDDWKTQKYHHPNLTMEIGFSNFYLPKTSGLHYPQNTEGSSSSATTTSSHGSKKKKGISNQPIAVPKPLRFMIVNIQSMPSTPTPVAPAAFQQLQHNEVDIGWTRRQAIFEYLLTTTLEWNKYVLQPAMAHLLPCWIKGIIVFRTNEELMIPKVQSYYTQIIDDIRKTSQVAAIYEDPITKAIHISLSE